MDLERGKEIWEAENRDIKIEQFIEDFVQAVRETAKSNKESFIAKTLREIFEEETILEGKYG